MISEDEVSVKLGLDARDFERRLRETDAIAKQYANKAGAALNQQGGMPQSWQGVGNLSKQSQAILSQGGGGGGLPGLFRQIGTQVSETTPAVGRLVQGIERFGLSAGLISVPVGVVVGALSMMKHAFYEVKEASDLDVSVSFLREVGRASSKAGENFEESKGRILKFQQVLASAAEGDKEALEKLGRVGIKDPTGKTLEENLRDVAKGLDAIPDKAKQAKAAVELFGKGAQAGMPDVLANLDGGNKNGVFGSANEDTATLAAGWKGIKGMWSKTGGAFGRYLKEGVQAHTAAALEYYFGVQGEVEQPTKLEKTQSPEAKAKAVKEAQDLAAAQKELNELKREQLPLEDKKKAYDERYRQLVIESRKEGLSALERKKLEIEAEKELAKFREANKQIIDKQNAAKEKQTRYDKQLAELEKRRADIQFDLARAKDDRMGWSLAETARSQVSSGNPNTWAVDSDGKPIIPEDVLRQREDALGRGLTDAEIQDMRTKAGMAMDRASAINSLEGAAKMDSLFGGKYGEKWQNEALGWRKGAGSSFLTSSEQDPFMSFSKSLENVDQSMTDLVTLAAGDGIKIQPRMARRGT